MRVLHVLSVNQTTTTGVALCQKKVGRAVIQAAVGRHLTVCTKPGYAILNLLIHQTIAIVLIPS